MTEKPAWVEADRRHVWHPYTQMLTAPAPLPVTHADGVYLYTTDGRRILDGISSWWVNIHGHNHPRLNAALAEQASKVAQVIFAGFTHEPGARLAQELAERMPGDLRHVFYSDDGSTAVEVAMKMAYQYWRLKGEPQRTLFVGLEHAYHGDTFGAMSASGASIFQAEFRDLLFTVKRAHAPYCLHCPVGKSRASCAMECATSLDDLLARDGERVAAVILEPMLQGAGGMIIWPPEFLRHVRAVTRAHGIPLIADEIFTGFGRTGKLFACEHGPVSPDIICVSKALTGGYLPLAATLTTDEIYSAFLSEERTRTFFHGHSYTGNALACAVGLASLQLFEEEDRLGRVAELERLFAARLAALRGHPRVAETRGLGALAVIELRPGARGGYLDATGPLLARAFLDRGILLRPLGNVLYFLPPYIITDAQVSQVFDVIEDVLGSVGP